MKKICIITDSPSPYKTDFFNYLGKEVQIYCLFNGKLNKKREKTWYKYNFDNFKAFYIDNSNSKKIIKEMANICDCLINSDYTNIYNIYAVNQFKKKNKIVIMHADGGLAVKRGIVDKVISYLMKKNDYFLSSGDETDKYYFHYGIDKEKIMHYHFACMSKEELNENERLLINKETCKKRCRYKEKTILLSVGQQIHRKGYDILLKSMKTVNDDVGLYIVGGKPQDELKQYIEDNNLKNVHFVDFKEKSELKFYYAGADIFVFPTRYDIWGLVINEAMSFGLPIISTDMCVAALEFNNKCNNAEIVKAEDPDALSVAINHLISSPETRKQLSKNSLIGIKDYSYETMVDDFVKIINNCLQIGKINREKDTLH